MAIIGENQKAEEQVGQHVPTSPSSEKPKIVLIPWDWESEEQCERLRLHRVACGWKADKVPTWRECQREGTMNLHWAVSGLFPSWEFWFFRTSKK